MEFFVYKDFYFFRNHDGNSILDHSNHVESIKIFKRNIFFIYKIWHLQTWHACYSAVARIGIL